VREAEVAQWAQEADATVIGPGYPIDVWPEASGVTRLWPFVTEVDQTSWEPEYGRLAEAQVRRDLALKAREGS
jgi:hypothetical protein